MIALLILLSSFLAIGSALRQSCLNTRSFHILLKELKSVVTTTLGIVVCHTAAIVVLQGVNLMFCLLVSVTRWIFTTTLLLARWVVVFVTLITITAVTTPILAFTVWPIWAIGWIWCLFPVRVATNTIVTTSFSWIRSCSSSSLIYLIGWVWWWLIWILFWWGRCACYLGLKCEELISLPPENSKPRSIFSGLLFL